MLHDAAFHQGLQCLQNKEVEPQGSEEHNHLESRIKIV